MFNTGQITLPKKWRSKFKTNKFIAKEEGNALIIKPIEYIPEQLKNENVEIYENGDGIRFKEGLSGEALDYFIKTLERNV